MLSRILLTIVICVLPCSAARAASIYSDVYFFGDSQLDTGNWLADLELQSHPLAPTADKGFFAGRWQEGPAFSDYFADLLGHDAVPSNLGGQNYAYGVSWLGPLPGDPAPTGLSAFEQLYLSTQVDKALADAPGGVLPSDALYVVTIGSNDKDFFGKPDAEADDRAGVALAQIERLRNAGATSFLVQTVGGTTPYPVLFNTTLLDGLAAMSGIDAYILNTRSFNLDVVLAAGFLAGLGIDDFGQCRLNDACLAAAIAAATGGDPFFGSRFFTFDGVHRNTKVLEAFANYAAAQLPEGAVVPEPALLSLFAAGVGAALVRRRIRR